MFVFVKFFFKTFVMNLKEFSDRMKMVRNKIFRGLELFSNSIDELTSTASSLKTSNKQDFRIMYASLEPHLEKVLSEPQIILQNHSGTLRLKEQEINTLRKERDKLKRKVELQEQKNKKIKRECESYEEKSKQLQTERDCIKAFKVLTRTHFAFKKGHTLGYIKPKNATTYEVFNYDNSEMSSEDRTKAVWSLVEKAVKDDRENIKKLKSS